TAGEDTAGENRRLGGLADVDESALTIKEALLALGPHRGVRLATASARTGQMRMDRHVGDVLLAVEIIELADRPAQRQRAAAGPGAVDLGGGRTRETVAKKSGTTREQGSAIQSRRVRRGFVQRLVRCLSHHDATPPASLFSDTRP